MLILLLLHDADTDQAIIQKRESSNIQGMLVGAVLDDNTIATGPVRSPGWSSAKMNRAGAGQAERPFGQL